MNRPLANSGTKIRLSEQKTKGYTIFLKKICNFAIKMANLLRLGNKNKSIYFVLHSTFRNFAADFYNNKVEFTF